MRVRLGRWSFDVVPVVCSWCGRFRKLRFWRSVGPRAATSHTICPRCQAKLNAQLEAM